MRTILDRAQGMKSAAPSRSAHIQAACTSFLALFSIVGIALYGLPFFYDFMVRDFGWTRQIRCSQI
jgi:hypothetical protein